MSRTHKSPASPPASPFVAQTQLIPIRDLHPNTWNVNRLNAFQYAKLLESISEYGFLTPILARPCPVHPDFEIVGGENRWRAAGELGYTELPTVVRQMVDQVARKISIIDNELHGQADPVEMGALLKGLLDDTGIDDLLKALPYTEDILGGFLGFDPLPPLPAPPSPPADTLPPAGSGVTQERWVERTYRMPADVAQVLDDAIEKAQQREKATSGQEVSVFTAIEIIAADFMAS